MTFSEMLNKSNESKFRRNAPRYRRASWDAALSVKISRFGNTRTMYSVLRGTKYTTIYKPTKEDMLARDWVQVPSTIY